ncbi:PREDICTED: protein DETOXIFICATION 17-like, partial [Nicotiana attenuata]|uniref:protein DETOXIFICATION 17-like n=1 Tax=Nicotiana attenuata TaxID=49451 RepID=UPI0009048B48
MVLLSGLLPNPKLESSVLSISVRVSNELGVGRPQAARLAACTAVFLVATEGIVAAIILISVRKLWGYCYSTEEEVVGYVAEMLVLIAGSHFLDGIQSVLSGFANASQAGIAIARCFIAIAKKSWASTVRKCEQIFAIAKGVWEG